VITFWVSHTPFSWWLAGGLRKMRHETRNGGVFGNGTGCEAKVLASRFFKGHHASAPQPQCSPCLFHSPWSETGRRTNDPLDASRGQALAPRCPA
jgi:hypothetical protein